MDNVTHTLAGALLGEAIARYCARSLPLETRRRVFVPTLALGSNLPDLDLLYTTLGQGKLDYLLHHRGHTHTILGALVLALGMWLLHEWLWRRRQHVPLSLERIALAAALMIGPLLHIAMDATNSYGVHPFWPFDNRWRYGDAVFIVEPLFWAAAAPLVFLLRSLSARVCVALMLVAGAALCVGTGMVPIALVCVFVGSSAFMMYAGYRWSGRAAVLGVAVWFALTSMFVIAADAAKSRLRSMLVTQWPQEHVLDVMLSPMPMNPVCWEAMLVQSADDAHFTVRRAVFSLAPHWVPASACPTRGLTLATTAPLQAVSVADTSSIQWHGELTLLRATLVSLYRSHCEVRALMQFARVPWVSAAEQHWLVGDLRYDREPQLGFAEIAVESGMPPRCPRWAAPWIPPRQDLLVD